MTERSNGGRFAKGTSGNRRGRPKSANRRLETPADLDEVIIDVMNLPTTIRTSAGEEVVPLFKATMLRLATGKAENRLAANYAISLMRQATWAHTERLKRLEKQRQYLEGRGLNYADSDELEG
jgi:hypothetical protein